MKSIIKDSNQMNKCYKGTNYILKIFFIISIILIPFNSLPYFKNLFGELACEGAFYPLLIGIILYIFNNLLLNGKIIILKNKINLLLMLFFIWVLVSGIFNMSSIAVSYTKGRTGIEKYILQVIVVIIGYLTFYFTYNVYKKNHITLYDLRKYIFISFLIVSVYCFLEILRFSNINFAIILLDKIDLVIRGKSGEYSRIRSVSGEASWFSMYASFAFPWIFSYVFERKNKFFYSIIFCYFLIIILMTKSRTGYFVILIQFVIYILGILKCKNKKIGKSKILVAIIFGISICMSINGYFGMKSDKSISEMYRSISDHTNLSNIARVGCQKSAIKMGVHNPIFGVGLGQFGFFMPQYVDGEALIKSVELQVWANSSQTTPWAPVHSLYARLIAEVGLVGFLIFIYICYVTLKKLFETYRQNNSILMLSLITSFIGILLSFLNIDSFRFFPFWIILGVILNYI